MFEIERMTNESNGIDNIFNHLHNAIDENDSEKVEQISQDILNEYYLPKRKFWASTVINKYCEEMNYAGQKVDKDMIHILESQIMNLYNNNREYFRRIRKNLKELPSIADKNKLDAECDKKTIINVVLNAHLAQW